MTLREPSDRRSLPVSLPQIRLDVRLTAARTVAAAEGDGDLLLEAALNPSATVYWVAASALPDLERIAA